MWIIDHEEDVASDLSAFHRIDDPMTLDAPRYFSLALRLTAYMGVMAAVAEAERRGENHGGSGAQTAARDGSAPSVVGDETALAMLSLDGWVEHEKGGD